MHVVATAGHVDHGKSLLVRALTGMEPDRFAEEKRRGMTIDLGYAWTRIGDDDLAFVDVPGHERFIGTMLAGLGPAPAVMFVVAADEGWRRQSGEHLAAIDALGLRHGLLVVTRSDLADPGPATAEARAAIAGSSLGAVPAVAVSGMTGAGLPDLRAALAALVATLPAPRTTSRLRLWVDRSFTVTGAGTVVTGTLGAGTLRVGDTVELGERLVRIRGLQSLGATRDAVAAVARVAVNLRDLEVDRVGRGDALLTPGAWPLTTSVDVRSARVVEIRQVMGHLGTASVAVRVRPLGGAMYRLSWAEPLPVQPGDRLVLRDPGRHAIVAGVEVLDVDPPRLRRRGAARSRAVDLAATGTGDPAAALVEQVRRRGAVRAEELETAGIETAERSGVQVVGSWLIDRGHWARWIHALTEAVDARAAAHPLDPRLSADAVRRLLDLPDRALVAPLTEAAGLAYADGAVQRPGPGSLGPAEAGFAELTHHLEATPFLAPERPDLDRWGLGLARARRRRAAGTGGPADSGGGAVADRAGPGHAGADRTEPAVHHQRGPAGARHHPSGGDPAARTPRPSRLDPAAGRRPP